jgi:hypothetical protein
VAVVTAQDGGGASKRRTNQPASAAFPLALSFASPEVVLGHSKVVRRKKAVRRRLRRRHRTRARSRRCRLLDAWPS